MKKRFIKKQVWLFVLLMSFIFVFSGVQLELKFSDGKLTEFEFEVKDFSNYLLSEFYFTLEKQIQLQAPIIHPSAQDFLDNYCKYMFDEQFPEYYFAECSGELNVLFEDYTLLYTSENLKLVQKICESYPESVLCDFSKIEFKDLDGALLQPAADQVQPVEDQEDASACLEEYEECISKEEDCYEDCEGQCDRIYQNCIIGEISSCVELGGEICSISEGLMCSGEMDVSGCCFGECIDAETACDGVGGQICSVDFSICDGGSIIIDTWNGRLSFEDPSSRFVECCLGSCIADGSDLDNNAPIPHPSEYDPEYWEKKFPPKKHPFEEDIPFDLYGIPINWDLTPTIDNPYTFKVHCYSEPHINPMGIPSIFPPLNSPPSEDEVSLGPRGGPGPGNKPPGGDPTNPGGGGGWTCVSLRYCHTF